MRSSHLLSAGRKLSLFKRIIKQQKNHANQYTFVWRKATGKYEKSLDDQYRQLALQIEQILEEEEKSAPSAGLEEKLKETPITSEQIEHSIKKLEKHLETEPKNKEAKKVVRLLKKDYLPRKMKYEEQNRLFNGRNSFSKQILMRPL
ncbi:hypothetical protein [Bacillus weihaiensis]|uniref:Transposase n=1 Tax=Bacillus weihaiensis TaxID=1547283 RepID=A0A1L3MTU9_9BACI|nr:hypothetical protein [Bacillus weihaiensis]APH05762.1 hypothetical protein A9C19_14045 [Bacillus weihaiensis]